MMSTSSHSKAENGVIQSSSIGLLQERFRQLQKMKEMRENKDLLRMFSDYNNNNNNNTTTTSSTNVIGVVCNTSSYTTTSTITSTTNTISSSGTPLNINNNNNNKKNNKNQISDYCSMQYNDQPLQIFIPPNYSSLNNPKSSCYSSSAAAAAAATTTTTTASTATPPPSSSSSSSSSQNSSNMRITDPTTDISLSLWPYNNNSTPATTYPFRQQNSDNLLLSTMNMQRQPVAGVAVSTSYKSEDPPHHVSDVDTTLHL